MEFGSQMWYLTSSWVLALLLYFPTSKMIWTLQIRRLERKLARKTTEKERTQQYRRARLLGGLIVITFAFLFTRTFM